MTSFFTIGDGEEVITSRGDTLKVVDGIIPYNHDGSFEDFLSESITISICTEVPAQADKIRRLLACKAYIDTFIREVRSCKTNSL